MKNNKVPFRQWSAFPVNAFDAHPKLKFEAMSVYRCLCDFRNGRTMQTSIISYAQFSKHIRLNQRSMWRWLNVLEVAGLIDIERRHKKDDAPAFRVTFAKIESVPPLPESQSKTPEPAEPEPTPESTPAAAPPSTPEPEPEKETPLTKPDLRGLRYDEQKELMDDYEKKVGDRKAVKEKQRTNAVLAERLAWEQGPGGISNIGTILADGMDDEAESEPVSSSENGKTDGEKSESPEEIRERMMRENPDIRERAERDVTRRTAPK